VIVQIKKDITDKWDYFNVLKLTSDTEAETAKSFGTREEIGCNMGPI
jgi:branched-chain amino acid transport system substrate-binding protein